MSANDVKITSQPCVYGHLIACELKHLMILINVDS